MVYSLPSSDSEILTSNMETEPEHLTKKPTNFDFVNDWVNVTVKNEIWRGKKLREIKPLLDTTGNEYDLSNIDFLASFCHENKRRERKSRPKSHKVKTNPSTRSATPLPRVTSASSAYSSSNRNVRSSSRNKCQKRCSMRTAELAVPSKRQCIDTWRYKSDVLPEFMVDRLKQHVMDQLPIVKIPEAINCFQMRRPHSARQSVCKTPENKNEALLEALKPLHQMNTRSLCIIFGQKITKILSTPINVTINSDLENLSRIVASDIAKIMPKPRRPYSRYNVINRQNKSILIDVSNIITVWIAGILEDLSMKLLEEDLRVKKKKEADAENTEQYFTIMETILQQEQKIEPTDLEEEEGPVLDFIDDVVDSVMNICEPPPAYTDEESETVDTSKDEVTEEDSICTTESTQNKTKTIESITDTVTESENLTDTEHFRKEINNIVNNIVQETDTEHFKNEINSIIDNIHKESEDDISIECEDRQEMSPEQTIEYDDNDEKFDETPNDDPKNTNLNDENVETIGSTENKYAINVSEGFDIFTEESDDDESSTKVKLSVTDLVNSDEINELIKINTTTDEGDSEDREEPHWNAHNDNLKSNVVFAEPNTNLLSDADESWPIDLYDRPLTKTIDTVSKSITSLGKIFEQDEKQMMPESDIRVNKDKNEVGSQTNKAFIKVTKETIAMESEASDVQVNSQTLDEDNICESIPNSDDKLKTVHPKDKSDIGSQTTKAVIKATKQTTTVESETIDIQVNSQTLDEDNVYESIPNINGKLNNVQLPKNKYDIASQTNNAVIKASKETITVETETSAIQGDAEELNKKNAGKLKQPTIDEKSLDKSCSLVNVDGNDTGRNEDKKIPSHKTQSDYGWKVHLKTAPSWVTSWGQGQGEPSEDSMSMKTRPTKVKESDLRKWCNDLEKAFINLEIWSDWIDSTCKEAFFLFRQKETTCPGLNRNSTAYWIRLQKNIQRDAILWNKLHQRTEDNFRNLKEKFNNIEYKSNEPSSSDVKKDIFEVMCEFEEVSMVLHKMIVTSEYCALCACNTTR